MSKANHALTAKVVRKILPLLEGEALFDVSNIIGGLMMTIAKNHWPNNVEKQKEWFNDMNKTLQAQVYNPIRLPRVVS